jgi:hypothetical protein
MIPCDMCSFTSVSADDYIKHIETKHQKKSVDEKEYACGRCDYKGRLEAQFKTHLEVAHNLNVGGFTKVSYSKNSKNPCLNWNRGNCNFDNCKFEQKEIPACRFNNRCSRVDCTFWHEEYTGKFPFLAYRPRQKNPNWLPRGQHPGQKM